MRIARCSLVLAVLLVGSALPAWSADPIPGLYGSASLGGVMLEGRASTSWASPGNAAMGLDDVWHSMSWNGTALGTQWHFECAVAPAVQAVDDQRDGTGTGVLRLTSVYEGGTFGLAKDGPWGDGVNDLTGTLNATVIIASLQYVNNVLVSGRTNISSSGRFDGSACTLTFLLTNGIRRGDTDCCTLPGDYPAFLAPDCSASRSFGSWSDIVDISLQIDCPVPVEESSWGNVKSLFR